MNYNIKIMPSALKFLKKQDITQQERLLKSIKNLPSNGDINILNVTD
jgi:mRNA-degrading endonuclease RelE of RelBE toxin-antitoxin system